MENFFTNIWLNITSLVWADYLAILILLTFIYISIKNGLAKGIINLSFFLIAIIATFLFYEQLASTRLIMWLPIDEKSKLISSFILIFITVIAIKQFLYKSVELLSKINNPCMLNIFFAFKLFIIFNTLFSWHYLDLIANLYITSVIITNESLRVILSFIAVFSIVSVGLSFMIKLLNISVDTNKPCLLAPFFQKIINYSAMLNVVLIENNEKTLKNILLFTLIGLINGILVLFIVFFILSNMNWFYQQNYWIEAKGILKIFKDFITYIKPELSEYLLFIQIDK
jgi:uncharacterized membrane protein required for colicin V production